MIDTAGKTGRAVTGAMTALVTPFNENGIDEPALGALVERQIAGGTDWLVPCGTTGESPTLTETEHDRVIELVIERSAGRCPVLAGAGSNCTAEAVRRSIHAVQAGADAILSVVPYYNRPPQEGLFRHFAAVAEAVDVPIVLYNVPFRTGVGLDNDTIVRLRRTLPNVVAVKHATGSVAGVDDLLRRCDITVLSGDDALTYPLIALGARGVISVVGNLVPGWMAELVHHATEGRSAEALDVHRRIEDLAESIGVFGPNPIPIKSAMNIAGLVGPTFRLPLCPLNDGQRTALRAVLKRFELV